MRPLFLAFTLGLSLGCGGIVDAGTTDAAAAAETPPKLGTGCPSTPPVGGQLCTSTLGIAGEHFYCRWFVGDYRCPIEDKCTNGADSTVTTFGGSSSGRPADTCKFTVDDCAEGLPCGPVFETSGRCIVGCKRSCACDRSTGQLRCTPLAC